MNKTEFRLEYTRKHAVSQKISVRICVEGT